MPALLNLLEPAALIRAFEQFPPDGFTAMTLTGAPAFAASFDLLTTIDPKLRRRIQSLPFARLLRARTLFVGTTVSEYALLPDADPQIFVRDVLEHGSRLPFVIVKDMPNEPVLVGKDALAWSNHVAEECEKAGFVMVEGQALAYVPIDFDRVDAYLERMSHARRKNIRRKLRSRSQITIEEEPIGGSRFDDDALLAAMYELYLNVYRQSEIHFDLLTPAFFAAVLRDRAIPGVVFLYRADGVLIGFNLCVFGEQMLIDKYVGFLYPQARDYNLYTVSWFHNLQRALDYGMRVYVAGWTDADIKRSLGARFTQTRHAVYVRNPIARRVLKLFKPLFEHDARAHS